MRKIFIITGMSGAGKSQALKIFEDFGFYCVDNLPLALVESFAAFVKKRADLGDIALGIDVREGKSLEQLPATLERLRGTGQDFRIIFLEASDAALIHRFSETRHRHPLGKNLTQAIRAERRLLAEIKTLSYKVLETSGMTLGEFKESLSRLLEIKRSQEMKIAVISFGYKYGIPLDADLVLDVRFLSNPNYIERLKGKTGLDKPVADYIRRDPRAGEFFKKLDELVRFLIPLYMKEGKSYLTIAIGCTGGRHRSVFIARELAEGLRRSGLNVSEFHRDFKKQ
ncbi:MAG: RNase adapter RapZ [Elusimicrobiales bacterium]|nr:RNase adapter RapZ [Elusimicrobiales bacterium]